MKIAEVTHKKTIRQRDELTSEEIHREVRFENEMVLEDMLSRLLSAAGVKARIDVSNLLGIYGSVEAVRFSLVPEGSDEG